MSPEPFKNASAFPWQAHGAAACSLDLKRRIQAICEELYSLERDRAQEPWRRVAEEAAETAREHSERVQRYSRAEDEAEQQDDSRTTEAIDDEASQPSEASLRLSRT